MTEIQEEALVKVNDFADKIGLEILYSGERDTMKFNTVNVNRPGLQLAGFFDYFASNRIQVLGNVEMTYVSLKTPSEKEEMFDKLFAYSNIPCVILSRNLEAPVELINKAKQYKIPLYRSDKVTTALINELIMYLNELLAPYITMHAGLLDVYGTGVLICGKSGIGKSETALELIKRGHRLVADDAVIIKKINDELIGTSPELIRHFMEIRGIGIININSLYGIGSVVNEHSIDMVVNLETWDNAKEYDRIGLEKYEENILGISLPKIIIPVKPGRNVAIIIEVAARNQKLKEFGYNAAADINDRIEGKAKKNI